MFANARRPLAAVLAAFVVSLAAPGLAAWFAAPARPQSAALQRPEATAAAVADATAHPWICWRDFAPLLWRS
ncbi:MAG: hypothetical protein U1F18_13490 [Steroidobacteraceae bacterium]|jgi:hypothetical protein